MMNISIKQAKKAGLSFNKNQSAFTLVEILITMAVISFGCLAALQMQATAIKGNDLADNMTVAMFLAESEMERIKTISYSKLKSMVEDGLATHTDNNINRLGESCIGTPCNGYIFTRKVDYIPKYPTTVSITVEITVEWRDTAGPHHVFYSGTVTSFSLNS
jgi:prepilin-type N-terminal cleavage/methylation domain-containing protein